MTELTTAKKRFIQLMGQSDEHAQWGFEALLKRVDFVNFFDALKAEGLFSFERSPKPILAEKPGLFRVPYWAALDYLVACANAAGSNEDDLLARKILDVVISVSGGIEDDGSIRDNYHTYSKFAEILGLLPLGVITLDDIRVVPNWLKSKFDSGLVASALDVGVFKKCLESPNEQDVEKACLLLEYCTELKPATSDTDRDLATVVDDYWLKELITHHARAFGIRAGSQSAEIFLRRLNELFAAKQMKNGSWLSRPAVEEHQQNHDWGGPINRFVEGLREVLLSWVEKSPAQPMSLLKEMLRSETEIAQRVAVFILNVNWPHYRGIFFEILTPALLKLDLLHEIYDLLDNHFSDFLVAEQQSTLDAIRQIPKPIKGRDGDRALKLTQRIWLSAIRGKGSSVADQWFEDLNSDKKLGILSDHPDFNAYMESWSGPGPSPYRVEEIQAFLRDGTLIERLNGFKAMDTWRGPTIRSLSGALEEAVFQRPEEFLEWSELFLAAARPYQYGFLRGLTRAWGETASSNQDINWAKCWEIVVTFIENLILDDRFWSEPCEANQELSPTRDWIPPVVSELLRSGTKNDAKAYPPELLPRAWVLIDILVSKSDAVDKPRDDAMTQAINSPKGKAIEALFSHALRVCRLSDGVTGEHSEKWKEMQPTFDREVAACKGKNFEFSTLAANYIANLEYLDRQWLIGQMNAIFPADLQSNFNCALEGLAYAPAKASIYKVLLDGTVIDAALNANVQGRHARDKLIERIALAYLWELEELTGKRFAYFLMPERVQDLERFVSFFWSLRNQELQGVQIEKILLFWGRCMEVVNVMPVPPAEFLSKLSRLSCYVQTIDERTEPWMMTVAHYVGVDFNGDDFIKELGRLVNTNPLEVGRIFEKVLEKYVPTFDYQNRLRDLIIEISQRDQLLLAIALVDRLRRLPGMMDLYLKLTQKE